MKLFCCERRWHLLSSVQGLSVCLHEANWGNHVLFSHFLNSIVFCNCFSITMVKTETVNGNFSYDIF